MSATGGHAAQAERRGDGQIVVRGMLTFDTVPALFAESADWLGSDGPIAVDLAGVERADSAGLALLVEWLGQARRAGRELRFVNVPAQVQSLTRVTGLGASLGIA